VSLKAPLWKLLRKYKLCHTVEEESNKRFEAATTVAIGNNPFSRHVMHALRALMSQEPCFNRIDIVPVDSGNLDVVANYHNGRLKIGEQCFTYEGAHRFSYCEHQSEGATELKNNFSCDHAVLWLWDHILRLFKDSDTQAFLNSEARAKVLLMPRAITFHTNEARNELYIQ
jgi:hypothetical protein